MPHYRARNHAKAAFFSEEARGGVAEKSQAPPGLRFLVPLDALTPADQQALLETAQQTEERLFKVVRAESAAALVELRKQGLTLIRNANVLGTEFPPIAQKVWTELTGSYISREAFQEVQRALADYRRGRR